MSEQPVTLPRVIGRDGKEYPPREEKPSLYAVTLAGDGDSCRACHQLCWWGRTVKGRRSLFDPKTDLNHWITCPRRKLMERVMKNRRVRRG